MAELSLLSLGGGGQPVEAEEGTDSFSIKRMHLGMAGLHHQGGPQPGGCWQHRIIGVGLEDCVPWTEQTIAYMTIEMDRLG